MRRKKILILPTLRDRNRDMSKKWYVEVSQRNPQTAEMVRCRFETFDNININSLQTLAERYSFAEKIINDLSQKIKNGWTVFNDTTRVIYEDQTQYAHEARVYRKKVESNRNYVYWCSRYIVEILRMQQLRKGTLITYESRYRVFKNWLIDKSMAHLDIVAITNDVIVQFFTYLRDELKHTAHTFDSYAGLLSSLFDFIIKEKGIVNNPVHNLPVNRHTTDNGAEALHKEDLNLIMKVMDDADPQLALACRFEYYCGLRPGIEVRLMKVGDLNLRHGVSRVKISSEHCKTTHRKDVIIPDIFLDYLINVWHLDKVDKNFFLFGRNRVPGILHLGKNTLRDRFNRIRDKLGLPNIYKFYSMKHTGAVTLAEQGETLINIRDHLGHSSVQTTEIYLKRHGFNDSAIIRKNFPKI
ncbi:MAG: site-specific integrase [Prevotellaceae bacterium]|jgi:integrase|nr:site-specific integrase [Prevotellaceae bacterium]